MVKRVLIAFDFDHTLIDETVDTYVLRLLPDGAQLPPSVMKLYSIHDWNDYQREVFRYLHSQRVTKDQLLSCVAEMPIVEGMRELLDYLVKSTLTTAKAAGKSGLSKVANDATVNGVVDGKVAHQQHSVTSGTATAENNSTGSAESGVGRHSMVDGKNPSDTPVQFEVIIVSDANSVSFFVISSSLV